jgi:TRAP-type C4-dicarboxylate transport system permease small subunit
MRSVLRAAARVLAVLGGIVLLLVVGVTLASVAGRAWSDRPVPGDVELVQFGTAAALALFLPLAQLHGSHLVVELFTARARPALVRALDRCAQVAAAVVLALLAWRAGAGVDDLRRVGETSMVLGFPLWIAYAALVPSLALAALIALVAPPEEGRSTPP